MTATNWLCGILRSNGGYRAQRLSRSVARCLKTQCFAVLVLGAQAQTTVPSAASVAPAARQAVAPVQATQPDTARNGNTPMNAQGLSGDPTRASKKLGKEFGAVRVRLYVEEIKRHLAALGVSEAK